MMNKLSGFFRSSGTQSISGNTRGRSSSQLNLTASPDSHQDSTQSSESSFFSSGTSTSTSPSRGLFSRMLSREDIGGNYIF